MTAQLTLNAIAGGTIRPYRFIRNDGTDNKLVECNLSELPLGITDGSNLEFDTDNHATATEGEDSVRIQPGLINDVEAGGAISAGESVGPDADGRAIQQGGGKWIAMEDAAGAGDVIRLFKIGGSNTQSYRAVTADETLTREASGSSFSNLAATGAVTLTLPQDAVSGDYFEFVVLVAQQFRLAPGAAGGVYIAGAKQADDKYVNADAINESVKLVADGNGDWVAFYTIGTWAAQT